MWYEIFELKNNPYDIRNLSEKVIGEEAQEKQLIKWLTNEKAVLLYGPTGVGKTTLVTNVLKKINSNEIPELKKFKCVYYSCDRQPTLKLPMEWSFPAIFRMGKRFIMIVDEAHFGEPKELIKMSSLWDNKEIFSVVYVQINETPKIDQLVRRIGIHKIKMRTITSEEIEELIKQRTPNITIFDEDAIKHIAGNCNLNPSIALQHCDSIAGELAEAGKTITLKDVKSFNLDSIKYQEEKLPRTEADDAIDKLQISPLQKKIIRHLRITSMTNRQLSDECDTSLGTISKQLNLLKKKNIVKITDHNKPKKYGLLPEFERTLLTD